MVDTITTLTKKEKVDCVLSDMAHSFTGNSATDHLLQLELCEAAFFFARANLKTGGNFLCKVGSILGLGEYPEAL